MIPVELLLNNGAVEKQLAVGEIVYNENYQSTHYYQVISGRIRLCNFFEDGKEVLHKIVCQNEGFGEVAILNNLKHNYTAVADSNCTLLKIKAEKFKELLNENPYLQLLITQQLVKDLRTYSVITKLICSHCPEEIIVNLIHLLNEDRRLICHECNRLMLTRQHLANMTGLRVETIIRTMKQMEKEDKLNIIKGKVFIPADGIGV